MADSTGINRYSGKSVSDWDHVTISLHVIFTTMLASRVMRRTFGSVIPGLLGRPLTSRTLMRFFSAIVLAVDAWEPRFRIIRVIYPQPQNSPDTLRKGTIAFQVVGVYRPRALQGDLTEEAVPRGVFFTFPLSQPR